MCHIYSCLFVYIFINEYLLCFWEKSNKILHKDLSLFPLELKKRQNCQLQWAKAQNLHMNSSVYRRMQNEEGWCGLGLQIKVVTGRVYISLSLWQVTSANKTKQWQQKRYKLISLPNQECSRAGVSNPWAAAGTSQWSVRNQASPTLAASAPPQIIRH